MVRRILASSLLLMLPAVATADVRVDVDRHKDFAKYRTFTVEIGPLVRTDGVVDEQNTLAETRLRQAVNRELQERGLEPNDRSANLVVRVSGRDTERTQIIRSRLEQLRRLLAGATRILGTPLRILGLSALR